MTVRTAWGHAGHATAWPAGPLRLASDEVHCWHARLDIPPETSAGLFATLTVAERDRATRFRFHADRQHFIAARGALRDILAHYLETEPAHIRFVYNRFGKPCLGGRRFGSGFEFNLSHAAGHALIAVAQGARVGVDLEPIVAERDHAEIARCFFSPAEVEQLGTLPGHRHSEAFLGLWTKKEAYLKARGQALTVPLNHVSMPVTTDAEVEVLDFGPDLENQRPAARWSVHALRPAPGFIGALVLEGVGRRLSQGEWRLPTR